MAASKVQRAPCLAPGAVAAAGPGTLAWLVHVAFVLLWAATVLAAWSLAIYLGNVWTHFVFPQVTKAH